MGDIDQIVAILRRNLTALAIVIGGSSRGRILIPSHPCQNARRYVYGPL